MSKKNNNFELKNLLNNAETNKLFDRLVGEIEPVEIPQEYIDHIDVEYKNGRAVTMYGVNLDHPIPVNQPLESISDPQFQDIKNMKIFIDTTKLAEEVNARVYILLNK